MSETAGRPTRPTIVFSVGHAQTVGAPRPSDMSDPSDTKTREGRIDLGAKLRAVFKPTPPPESAPNSARLAELAAHIRGRLAIDAAPRSAGCVWCGAGVSIEGGSPILARGGHAWVHRERCHAALAAALDAKAMDMARERLGPRR